MIGNKIQNYIIEKKIASGNLSEIFFASHSIIDRKVVIHEFKNSSEKFNKRILVEAKVLSELDHPSIVKLIDFVEVNNKIYWIVEYCEGITLLEFLRTSKTALSENQIIYLFEKIINVIQYIHSIGLLHNNLNLNNILITPSYNIKILKIGYNLFDKFVINNENSIEKIFKFKSHNPILSGLKNDIYSLGLILLSLYFGNDIDLFIEEVKNKQEINNSIDLNNSIFKNRISEKTQSVVLQAIDLNWKSKFVNCELFSHLFVNSFDNDNNPKSNSLENSYLNKKLDKNEIKKLLSDNKIFEAIDFLALTTSSNNPELHNQIILQSSSLHELTKKINMGIIYEENAVILRNKIVYSLINIVDEIKTN